MDYANAGTWNIGSEGIKTTASKSWKMQKVESGIAVLSDKKKIRKNHVVATVDAYMYSFHLLGRKKVSDHVMVLLVF